MAALDEKRNRERDGAATKGILGVIRLIANERLKHKETSAAGPEIGIGWLPYEVSAISKPLIGSKRVLLRTESRNRQTFATFQE